MWQRWIRPQIVLCKWRCTKVKYQHTHQTLLLMQKEWSILFWFNRYCLNWCRGEALNSLKTSTCVLQHTKTIIDCFQANRDRLPSPPLNLAVMVVSNSEVLIKWEPPKKNAHMVEGYRVYWHEVEPTTENNPINNINGIGMLDDLVKIIDFLWYFEIRGVWYGWLIGQIDLLCIGCI